MAHGYDGVYMLELVPERFYRDFAVKAGITTSVSILKTAIFQVMRRRAKREEYQTNYLARLRGIEEKSEKSKCGLGVLGHAMYILKMGNTKIAIDPVFMLINETGPDREALLKMLQSCDAAIVTHEHHDHYEAEMMEKLSAHMPCFIPDFIRQTEKSVAVKPGDEIGCKDVKLTFFESAHSVPNNSVPEYGFAVEFEGKNYVFPCDVRDYKKAHATFPNTKAVLLHLWLGKGMALNPDTKCVENFCEFAKSFRAEHIYISHLLDFCRDIQNMWSEIHFDMIKNKLQNSSALQLGDFIEL